jgi:hypothetical protein
MDGAQLSAHDTAMIAKVDAASAAYAPVKEVAAPVVVPVAAPAAPAQRPADVPEKFWDAAKGEVNTKALLASYTEAEKKLSAAPAAKAAETPVEPPKDPKAPEGEPPEGDPAAAAAKAAEDAAKAAGADTSKVDFAALTQEFATAGALSDDSFAKLEAAGMSKDLVNQFIAGQVALQQATISEAHGLAGGADAYSNMVKWAGANLSPAEQAAFDAAVTGDSASRKQAITALKAQYTAAHGTDPKLVTGEGTAQGAQAFQSRAEVTAAMRDPRYKADPAYRAEVERKLEAMTVF